METNPLFSFISTRIKITKSYKYLIKPYHIFETRHTHILTIHTHKQAHQYIHTHTQTHKNTHTHTHTYTQEKQLDHALYSLGWIY